MAAGWTRFIGVDRWTESTASGSEGRAADYRRVGRRLVSRGVRAVRSLWRRLSGSADEAVGSRPANEVPALREAVVTVEAIVEESTFCPALQVPAVAEPLKHSAAKSVPIEAEAANESQVVAAAPVPPMELPVPEAVLVVNGGGGIAGDTDENREQLVAVASEIECTTEGQVATDAQSQIGAEADGGMVLRDADLESGGDGDEGPASDDASTEEPSAEDAGEVGESTGTEGEAAKREDGGDESAEAGDRDRLDSVLESLLFAAGAPLQVRRMVQVLGGPKSKEVRMALKRLMAEYCGPDRGIHLVEVAGGFQFRTAPENAKPVRTLLREKPARLGRAALETLSIVAYKQPVTRGEIEAVRGVDADSAINTLQAKRLIKIDGRKESVGRPLLYSTTPEFLELFGLKDLKELPTLKEIGPVPEPENETDIEEEGIAADDIEEAFRGASAQDGDEQAEAERTQVEGTDVAGPESEGVKGEELGAEASGESAASGEEDGDKARSHQEDRNGESGSGGGEPETGRESGEGGDTEEDLDAEAGGGREGI